MTPKRAAQWALGTVYGPSVGAGGVEVEKRINSTRMRVVPEDQRLPDLFVKLVDRHYQENHLEPDSRYAPSVAAANQARFRAATLDPIGAPVSLAGDDDHGVIVTEYVRARNLKEILVRPFPSSGFDQNRIIGLAGKALACWHAISPAPDVLSAEGMTPRDADPVHSFLDFSVWNILVAPDYQSIYVIDFPGSVVPGPRERDLATFLHSLLVVKLHPLSILSPRQWWSWQNAYSMFLSCYSEEAGMKMGEIDFQLIGESLRTLVRKELDGYSRLDGGLLRRFEARWYSRLLGHPAVWTSSLQKLLISKGTSVYRCGGSSAVNRER